MAKEYTFTIHEKRKRDIHSTAKKLLNYYLANGYSLQNEDSIYDILDLHKEKLPEAKHALNHAEQTTKNENTNDLQEVSPKELLENEQTICQEDLYVEDETETLKEVVKGSGGSSNHSSGSSESSPVGVETCEPLPVVASGTPDISSDEIDSSCDSGDHGLDNGVEPSEDCSKSGDDQTVELRFIRGEHGAGWTSSNMTKLHSLVCVRVLQEMIEYDYTVDVSGQNLHQEDHDFWQREVRYAQLYVDGDEGRAPRDLRPAEEMRAKLIRKDAFTIGFVLMLVVWIFAFLWVFIG